MFFEEKVEEINGALRKLEGKRAAVWCLGRHTQELLEHTKILKYGISFFIDQGAGSRIGKEAYGRAVLFPEEADFGSVDFIVVSTYRHQDEIVGLLKAKGALEKAVALYSEREEGEFYFLPKKSGWDFYFTGDHASWDEAERSAEGYGSESIVQKVLDATRQVMEGKACFERDSALFYEKEFDFRLACVFGVLAARKKRVSVLDFGGALGSGYWKNRELLRKFGTEFTWNVVEQGSYAAVGKEKVSNGELMFYDGIDEVGEGKADLAVLSSVLQYLPDYKGALSKLMALEPEYILIERQPVGARERICVQHVNETIYRASYPARIIDEGELMGILGEKYSKVAEFGSEADGGRAYADGMEFKYKGYLMERMENEGA